MVVVDMEQTQLIRSIEQLLENLMTIDEELVYQYEDELYRGDDMEEPIVEKFTSELLAKLQQIAY
jgi:hypothetical protein